MSCPGKEIFSCRTGFWSLGIIMACETSYCFVDHERLSIKSCKKIFLSIFKMLEHSIARSMERVPPLPLCSNLFISDCVTLRIQRPCHLYLFKTLRNEIHIGQRKQAMSYRPFNIMQSPLMKYERIRHNWTGTTRQLFNWRPIKHMFPTKFLFIVYNTSLIYCALWHNLLHNSSLRA